MSIYVDDIDIRCDLSISQIYIIFNRKIETQLQETDMFIFIL